MSITTTFLENGNSNICEKIIRSLPDWFGLEEAIKDYIKNSTKYPMIVAEIDGLPVGFISVKHHTPFCAEIYVMGILPDHHRKGVGKTLVVKAEEYLATQGVEFFQVKTLDESRECDHYKKTRIFYKSLGFKEFEVFPTLWDEFNPCLLMAKSLNQLNQ